jgi:hypothetical protein
VTNLTFNDLLFGPLTRFITPLNFVQPHREIVGWFIIDPPPST